MTTSVQQPGSFQTGGDRLAGRLLASAARHNYDPDVDLDWDAPPVPGLYWTQPERTSLYGTYLWDRLDEDQRIELTKHEAASIASVGAWFEIVLMQLLLREVYNRDVSTPWVHYALTEIADECRHSTMFGRAITAFGAPSYGPSQEALRFAKLAPVAVRGASMFAATLIGEEPADRLQRDAMNDERLQPIARMIARIHVLEEARHVSFARAELVDAAAGLGRAERAWHQWITAQAAFMTMRSLVNPRAYAAVGIDPREGRHAALGNPNYRGTIAWMGERVVPFLQENGMVGTGGQTGKLWRASFLLR